MQIRLLPFIALFGFCAANAETLNDFKPLEQSAQTRTIRFYDFDRETPEWKKLPSNYQLLRGAGANGTGALVLSRPPGQPYVFARQRLSELASGQRCRLTADVKITGLLDSDGKPPKSACPVIGMDFSQAGKWIGSAHIGVSTVEGNCDWQQVATDFTVPKNAGATVCFFLNRRYSCAQIAWDNVKIEQLGDEPPVLYSVLPKHLKLDKTGKVKLRVADFVQGRSEKSLRVFGRLKNGKELSASITNEFAELTLGELPEGTHRVEFFVVDLQRGKVIAEAVYPFTVVKRQPPAGAVETDESGRLLVDGKPFFPVGFFLEQPALFTPDDLANLREAGVNTLLPYRSVQMRWPENKGDIGIAAVKKSMDYMRQNDMKIIFSLLEITGRIQSMDRYEGLTDKNEIARLLIDSLKDHPALLAWYVSDEHPVSKLGPVRDLRFLISDLDPFHPAATLTHRSVDYVFYGPTGDFMMMDPYPVVNESTQSMKAIRECFELQARNCRLGAWFVPQAFNWGVYRKHEKYSSFRYPTEQEMRSHSLLALNYRIRGICFYAYDPIKRAQERHDPGSYQRFWPQVANVTRLLSELAPFFLAEAKPQPVKLTSSGKSLVEAKLHTAENRSMVVITSDGPGEGHAILEIGRSGLKSRFGLTRELDNGKYEFKADNVASDILE